MGDRQSISTQRAERDHRHKNRGEWYLYWISPEQFEEVETVSGSLGTIARSPSRELHSRGPVDADPVASIARLMCSCHRGPARHPTASSKP